MRDHRSMALTSVKSGMVIFSWEARLLSLLFFCATCRSRALRPKLCRGNPAFRYWMLEVSQASIVLLGSPSPITASEAAISFLISSVLNKIFSCGSICEQKEESGFSGRERKPGQLQSEAMLIRAISNIIGCQP